MVSQHSCPMCAQAKPHKANRGDVNATKATDGWQDIHVNFGFFVQCLSGQQDKKKPQSKQHKESEKSQSVQSLHDLKALTCAQRKKLSTQATADNGNPTDTTTTSTDAASDSNNDCNPVNALASTPIVETVQDDDSSLDSPSMPDFRVPQP